MRIRIKLSVTQDMDIITLTQCQFPVAEWLKIALKSYVEDNRIAVIPLPEMPEKIRREKCEINFSLHEVRDEKVIHWLKSLYVGQRTGAIKTIFRCSLSAPCLAGHISDGSPIISAPVKRLPQSIPSITPSYSPPKREEKKKTPVIPVMPDEDDDDFDIFGFNPDR